MTNSSTEQQVAIIGGGAASWWLAYELAARRVSCAVIDNEPSAGFSSTRNQGWLQSGALYAATNDPTTAEECQRGYHFLRYFAPELIEERTPCYFLFAGRSEREQAIDQCDALGIFARPVDTRVLAEQPFLSLLGNTPLSYAVEVLDRPVNTHGLLTKIAYRATQAGAKFLPTGDLGRTAIDRLGVGWEIRLNDGQRITAKIVVLACGTMIPQLLAQHIPQEAANYHIERIGVLVLHQPVSKAMLITPNEHGGPNLVPFGFSSRSGATICLSRLDRPAIDAADFRPEIDRPNDHLVRHARAMKAAYPGLADSLSNDGIPAHFYACQKLKPNDRGGANYSRGSVLRFHVDSDADSPLVVFYAGKFTSAPVTAQQCADQLEDWLERHQNRLPAQTPPQIAQQRYFEPPTHRLGRTSGRLVIAEN